MPCKKIQDKLFKRFLLVDFCSALRAINTFAVPMLPSEMFSSSRSGQDSSSLRSCSVDSDLSQLSLTLKVRSSLFAARDFNSYVIP